MCMDDWFSQNMIAKGNTFQNLFQHLSLIKSLQAKDIQNVRYSRLSPSFPSTLTDFPSCELMEQFPFHFIVGRLERNPTKWPL